MVVLHTREPKGIIGYLHINMSLLQEKRRDIHSQLNWQQFATWYCLESSTQRVVHGFHIKSFMKGVLMHLAQSRGVWAADCTADARMECVERHVGATKKKSIATVDALVMVIAVNEVTG
jgi:hypothetical protein